MGRSVRVSSARARAALRSTGRRVKDTDTMTEYAIDIPIELARAAHSGTSFVPERRGEQEQAEYAGMLRDDYAVLSAYATTDAKRATLEVEFARYRDGLKRRYVLMLTSKSRCVSWMIAGRSNFPVRRQE